MRAYFNKVLIFFFDLVFIHGKYTPWFLSDTEKCLNFLDFLIGVLFHECKDCIQNF